MKRLTLGALSIGALMLFGACAEEKLVTPTAATDCEQVDVGIAAQRERTGQEVNFFDSGERIVVGAVPLGWGGQLNAACRYPRTATWTIPTQSRNVRCQEYGEVAGLSKIMLCETFAGDGDVMVCVKHGGFGNCRTFRVIF